MQWKKIETEDDLSNLIQASEQQTQIIFKHSTTCSISQMALGRLERQWASDNAVPHFLDLLSYRSISNEIAKKFNVQHESPQILVIKKGACTFDTSHGDIRFSTIEHQL